MVKTYSKKSQGDIQLSAHFKVKEFACKDGADTILIDERLPGLLQKIRDHFGKPITINSAYRTAAHNKKVGGAASSQHLTGGAADIVVSDTTPAEVAKYAESIGILGIGRYTGFVHVDTRANKSFWRNDGKGDYSVSTHGGAPSVTPASSGAEWVKKLQRVIGTNPDGIIGPKTLAACPNVAHGAKGDITKLIQERLNALGFTCGSVDGAFGDKTKSAVISFQKSKGLKPDGIVGDNTLTKLGA